MLKTFKMKFRIWMMSILIVSPFIVQAGSNSFVADLVMKDHKGKITTGSLYFLNSTYRYNFQDKGKNLYVIVNINEPEGIVIHPAEQAFSRMDKISMGMAGNIIETYTVAENFVSQGFYTLSSQTEEEYLGLKCTKKVYLLNYQEPSGLSKEELKAAEVWVAQKYNFPIKIITYNKGKEYTKYELKNIREKEVDPSLFTIPTGYKEMFPEPPKKK